MISLMLAWTDRVVTGVRALVCLICTTSVTRVVDRYDDLIINRDPFVFLFFAEKTHSSDYHISTSGFSSNFGGYYIADISYQLCTTDLWSESPFSFSTRGCCL
jgi:hypothetical protein